MPEHPFDNGEMTIRDEQLEAWPRTQGAIRRHLADYYGMVSHMDDGIGKILDVLEESGQAGNTLVVYTSDHGLAVGSHGLMGKKSMYEHSVRSPLIVRGPGVARGRRSDALCCGYDLYPTLCDWAGADPPEEVQGKSLKSVLAGGNTAHRETVFGVYRDVQRMACASRWKYIKYPKIGRQQSDGERASRRRPDAARRLHAGRAVGGAPCDAAGRPEASRGVCRTPCGDGDPRCR